MVNVEDEKTKRHRPKSTDIPGFLKLINVVPKAAIAVAVLVGCLVLAGWLLEVEILKRVFPGLVAMNPATALAFILAGASLLLLQAQDKPLRLLRLAQGLAFVVALVGLLKLVGILFGWDFGIDQLLFRQKLESEAAMIGVPNQMAPNSALNFLLLGCALLLINRQDLRSYWFAQFLILVAVVASLLALIGYAYGVRYLYGIFSYIPMALHTAVTFIVLLVAILCIRPDRGLIAIIASDRVGGVVARRLLPAAIFVPVVLGWLRLRGQQAGLYDSELGVALMTVSSMTIFAVLVVWSARLLNRTDGKREQAEEELRRAYEDLDLQVQERTAELAEVNSALRERESRYKSIFDSNVIGIFFWNIEGGILRANDAFLEMLGYTREDLRSRGLDWRTITPEEYRPVDDEKMGELLATRSCEPFEKEYIRKDGSRVPVVVGAALLEGYRDMGIYFALDITDRKRAENTLRFFAEASAVLASSLDYQATLESVARLVVPDIADWCAVDIIEADG
ncbi:MAG: PAS domain S-box protein, partial [Rubrobacteraceae bacterium]